MELVVICLMIVILSRFLASDVDFVIKVIFGCGLGLAIIILSAAFGYHDAQYERRQVNNVDSSDSEDD